MHGIREYYQRLRILANKKALATIRRKGGKKDVFSPRTDVGAKKKKVGPPGARTQNLLIRSQTPYHWANGPVTKALYKVIDENLGAYQLLY